MQKQVARDFLNGNRSNSSSDAPYGHVFKAAKSKLLCGRQAHRVRLHSLRKLEPVKLIMSRKWHAMYRIWLRR